MDDYIQENFKFVKIQGESSRLKLRELEEEMSVAATSVEYDYYDWAEDHGCLVYVIAVNRYEALTDLEFEEPSRPPRTHPDIDDDTSPEERADPKAENDESLEAWYILHDALKGLTANLRDAIDPKYYQELKKPLLGYKKVAIRDYLEHIKKSGVCSTPKRPGSSSSTTSVDGTKRRRKRCCRCLGRGWTMSNKNWQKITSSSRQQTSSNTTWIRCMQRRYLSSGIMMIGRISMMRIIRGATPPTPSNNTARSSESIIARREAPPQREQSLRAQRRSKRKKRATNIIIRSASRKATTRSSRNSCSRSPRPTVEWWICIPRCRRK